MNLRKLMKWTLVLIVILAFKQLDAFPDGKDAKPVYLSTQRSGQ